MKFPEWYLGRKCWLDFGIDVDIHAHVMYAQPETTVRFIIYMRNSRERQWSKIDVPHSRSLDRKRVCPGRLGLIYFICLIDDIVIEPVGYDLIPQ